MAPYYESLCKELKWQQDAELLAKMKQANEGELKRLDAVLEDAEKNLGESEIRDAMMAKAEYLIRIGNKVRFMLKHTHTHTHTHTQSHIGGLVPVSTLLGTTLAKFEFECSQKVEYKLHALDV